MANDMVYGVMCRVSGGFTGTREAWLKTGSGKDTRVAKFATLAEAEAEAAKHNAAMNSSPYRTASFSYWAAEYDPWY